MKFIVIDNPKVLGFFLRKLYHIKKIDFSQT